MTFIFCAESRVFSDLTWLSASLIVLIYNNKYSFHTKLK